jgi:hypothetical protein
MATIEIHGRRYEVRPTESNESPYEIVSPKGIVYSLLRNRVHPEMLFAVAPATMKVPDWWFTDTGGALRYVGGGR